MAFTKRHYEEVARIILARRVDLFPEDTTALMTLRILQGDLRRMFAADNPRFDGTRFDMACDPKGEK